MSGSVVSSFQFCEYSNMPQNTWVTIGLENYRFTMRNTITEDKLTNTFIARTGLALCRRVFLDSVAHWWVPARTPTVHQCLYGGRPWVARSQLHTLQRHALVTNTVAEPVC